MAERAPEIKFFLMEPMVTDGRLYLSIDLRKLLEKKLS